jgi:hypothetical protein
MKISRVILSFFEAWTWTFSSIRCKVSLLPSSDSWVFSAFFQARNGQHSGTLTRTYWWTVWNLCNITFTVNWRNRDWLVHRTQWDNWTKRQGIDKRWKLIYWLKLYHLYIYYSSKFKEKKSNLVKRNEIRKISKF